MGVSEAFAKGAAGRSWAAKEEELVPLLSGIWAGAGLQVEELLTGARAHWSDVSCYQLSSGP